MTSAEGERIEPGEELSENARFWHGEKNLIDILGEDKLVELYGLTPEALEEQSVLRRFYLSYSYTATLYDNTAGRDGNTCLLNIDGLPGAVAAATAVNK